MLKKILVGIILSLLAGSFFLFFVLRNIDSFKSAEVSEAVSSNAILFVDKIDYEFFTEEFRNENLLWNDLLLQKDIGIFDSLLNVLSAHLGNMPILFSRLKDQGLSFSVHLLGLNKIALVYYITLGEHNISQDIDRELKAVFGEEILLNVRKYEAVELTDVSLNNSNVIKGFSYAIQDGLLIASTSSILLEDAIRTLNTEGGIFHQKGFKNVSKTAGKYVQGNVYLNYRFIDQLFYPLVGNNLYSKLSSLNELANWGEFDVDLRENIYVLNGMSYAEDSLKGWLNVFIGQAPVRLEATSNIPSNAVQFMSMGISDIQLFKKQFREELKLRNQLLDFQNNEKRFINLLGESPFDGILDLLNDEIVKFTIDAGNNKGFKDVVLFEVRSNSEAKERLEGWLTILAEKKGKTLNDYTNKYVLDEQTKYTIYDFPDKFYKDIIVGTFFKSSFAFFENYIIFSDSHDAIKRTIYQNILHKTLTNEDSFEEVNHLISTKANLTFFLKPDLFLEKSSVLFKNTFKNEVASLSEIVHKMPGFIIQFSNEDGMFYSGISLKYSSSSREKAMTVWESLLDSMAITKPELVINHNTSEKEILVQDATHSVCLLNSTGRILWRVKAEGPILSEIYQVDYYKNGKLQYLFSTAKGIHLLDRNGNYVERYPVKFRADATNGIVLFDYDNRKDYRLFVACADRKVYAYDLEGKIIPGWSFKKSEGTVDKPIQHFRINEKDYIVFSDPVRSYILDRKGDERVKIKEQKAISHNNSFYLDMNVLENRPRFVTTDTSGNVLGIDINGGVEKILEHKAGPDHFFRTKDLDRDGNKEFVFADGNNFEVLDLKGKRLFSFKIKSDISILPDIYEFSSTDLKIGLIDDEKNLIYLLNSDGTLYEGFPLEGNTRFSIGYFAGSDSRFNLIVGSQNGFLYNYSIE